MAVTQKKKSPAKDQDKAPVKAKPKKPTVMVKLYLVNPYTNQRFFKGESGIEVEIDSWVQSQIDSGLLVLE